MWLSENGHPINLRDDFGDNNDDRDDNVIVMFYEAETCSQSMQTIRSPESLEGMEGLAVTKDQK